MSFTIGMRSTEAATAILAVAVVCSLLFLAFDLERSDDAGNDDEARRLLEATVAGIAAASRGDIDEPPIEAAPQPPGAVTALLGNELAGDAPAPPLPDGYSYAEYHGEMTKERLPAHSVEPESAEQDGPDWLGSRASMEALATQAAAAERDWSFGWIRLANAAPVTDLSPVFRNLGVQVLGSSGSLVRARLPGDPDQLEALLALPGVTAAGAVPPQAKLPGSFAEEMLALPPHELVPVFITLMDVDSHGQWRRALEAMGTVVGRFDPDIRAYVANITPVSLRALAAADFVLAIEPVGIVHAAHETAVPAMGADVLRTQQNERGLFSGVGGRAVPIGVMDSGLNVNHTDIGSHRASICGTNFVANYGRIEDQDLWVDAGEHGTHVTGTILGNGFTRPELAGMAPSVSHIRLAKVLTHFGQGSYVETMRGMDFLAKASGCNGSVVAKPLIVNMSLAVKSPDFDGKGIDERKLDAIVWQHRQLYVVAQANADRAGFSNYAAAKNSLAVGAVQDNGAIASFSSRGPTADGRLAPQVVAVGVSVTSTKGDGSRLGYTTYSGTSMAAPATAGVAALMLDRVAGYRERPALARARLMASAIRPDAVLDDATVFPSDNSHGPGAFNNYYGLGKVSAHTSVLNRHSPDGWENGSVTARVGGGEYAFRDIVVPEGASRLDLVMTWDEPPADTIASSVLSDLDLWLDHGGNCGAGACGEFVSRSRRDNVEWLFVRNPEPGIWRAKVVPRRIYGTAPEAALAWTLVRGAATPQLRV